MIPAHLVFVDFENVPTVDLGVVEGKPVHVTLLIGKKQTWLDLPLVRQIHRLAAQVELIEVGASGRNALDLTLAWYLGAAAKEHAGAVFHIVSKDKDFDPLIAHLAGRGTQVARHDAFADLPFLNPPKKSTLSKPPFAVAASTPKASPTPAPKVAAPPKPKPAADKLAKFIIHLRKNPPANRTKLEHMIAADFKPSLLTGGVKGVITELEKRGVITIEANDKVTYR